MDQKTVLLKVSLHKFVHLKSFWTQLKTCTCEVRAAWGRVSRGLTVMPPWNLKLVKILKYGCGYICLLFDLGFRIIRMYPVSWFPNCVVTWSWPTLQPRPGLYWISHGKTLDSPGHKDVHLCSPSLPVHNAPMWMKLFMNWKNIDIDIPWTFLYTFCYLQFFFFFFWKRSYYFSLFQRHAFIF